jgi:S1-C subfamily serine protease
MAKSKGSPSLIWLVLLGAFFGFSLPANATLRHAAELLQKAEQATNAAKTDQAIGFLNAALIQIKNKPINEWPAERREKAISDVSSAISDLQSNDASKASEDITQAIAVCENKESAAAVEPQSATESSSQPAPAIAQHASPTVKLSADQASAVVLIKGDNAEGTGFLVKTPDGPVVMTNLHVISNNPNLQITTNTGVPVTILSYKGATDRDMARISIKDGTFKYLTLATDISSTVQPGDEVITPGNSEGGEVMLNTDGKVLGIGPDRVEIDNPIYHGNSGGPILHVKSGQVIGIVTEAMKVDLTDALDKASFASRSSAISSSMRYFGLRLDTVPGWETYDLNRFENETAFLDQFDKRSRCLDCFLNAPNDNKPDDILWREDDKIMKANSEFFAQSTGADIAQKLDADKIMWSEITDISNTDMDAIQNPNNFYLFDRQRAKDEIAYRKAIIAELTQINNDVSRMGSLPRTNN